MKLFITGASGFVGGATAKEAVLRGHEVTAMSRNSNSDSKLGAFGATPVSCSLDDISADHLKGCDAVVHAAAFVKQWGTREEFWSANVTGTENVLKAARDANIKRFIHIGTEAALFRGQPMLNIDESTPYPESTPYLYSETKREAEKRVIQANSESMQTVSIRPRMIWGPGDQALLPVLVDAIHAKRFVWIDNGRELTNTTHINNLVHAIFLALETDKKIGGELFFVTDNEEWTFKNFFSRLLETQGIKVDVSSVKGWMARTVAFIDEYRHHLLRKKTSPALTRFGANILSRPCTINIAKIRMELGYEPIISVEKGLAEMSRSGA